MALANIFKEQEIKKNKTQKQISKVFRRVQMLAGNSGDFQTLPIFYLDPQTRAIAQSINEEAASHLHYFFSILFSLLPASPSILLPK